jgi:leukotriene-A4 hydrolase
MRPLPPLVLALLAACSAAPVADMPQPIDPHSFAEPQRVRSRHVDLDLTLDFAAKVAHGRVVHALERLDKTAPFVVDTDGLDIRGAFDQHGQPLFVDLASLPDPLRGRRLAVRLRADTDRVRIDYATSPDAEAMQWLAPEQTEGGKQPFLFTQGQAILTRSWIPLQDSPSVRVTWQARIQAPAGLVPLMSAMRREERPDGAHFAMDRAVPPYLIALACGDLASRPLSGRCAVWAEPSMLDLAASELADTEAMVAACEDLFGPYRWGRYDVLVLPPSFPFGGMENPCLTFATPTILAGDKSLVSLIAHELAHSWSGNLVTNATWRDFWLNEGFTVYLEQRIMERVFGRDRAVMETRLGMQELADELGSLPAADQRLHLDLTGRNPDDAMTAVAYQKGAAFLRTIEQAFGRERLDAFLRGWFDAHAFQSVTTAQFLACLQRDLLAVDAAAAARVDVGSWVDGSGLPAGAHDPESSLFAAVDAQLAAFRGGAAPATLAVDGWTTQQWLRFLHGLGDCAPARMGELDGAFHFTRTGNSEVLCAWLYAAIRNDYRGADRRLELFLLTVGRRKFVKPLYEALLGTPDGRTRARAIYDKARPRYHAVTQRTLDALFAAAAR